MKRYSKHHPLSHSWKIALLTLAASVVLIWLIKAPLLGAYLTNRLRVPVSVDWIGVWPSHTNLHGFRVKNPRGFKDRTAFMASNIASRYQLRHLFGSTSVIDQIEIRHSLLNVDLVGVSGNNWTAIAKRMPKNRSRRHVSIRKLILVDFNVAVHGSSLLGGTDKRHFDRLEFTDIDSERGFPTSQVVQGIFREAGMGGYIEEFFDPVNDIETILSPVRIFGG